MDLETLLEEFPSIQANYNTEGWSHDYHLQIDDNSLAEGGECLFGEGCTPHTITVLSEVAQDVFLTLHTWDDRGLPASCKNANQLISHSIGPVSGGTH